MNTPDNLTKPELDSLVLCLPSMDENPMPVVKHWERVDVGNLEVYVGDGLYIVALVEKLPETMEEIEKNSISAEDTVIRYLKGEGFIGDDYAYVGLQRFNLMNPPKGLGEEEL